MPNSQHYAVRAAVAALFLAGEPPLADGNIFENRDYALAEGVTSQIHVNRVSSQPEMIQITGAPIDWTTEIELRFKARKTDYGSADDVCDQLWSAACALLLANQTLGGLAMQIDPGDVSFDQDSGDTNVAEITQIFKVMHRTAGNTIS
jgi:hypothetical protein